MKKPLQSLLSVKYSGLDFSTHLDDLRSRMQLVLGEKFNLLTSSVQGSVLLDTIGYALDSLSFYLDRRATDNYVATARTRRALSRLTRQLGYKMRPAVSSSLDLVVHTTQGWPFQVPIPAGFQFRGPNQTIFEVAEQVIIPAGSTTNYVVSCYQGRTVTETFVGTGDANQVFDLSSLPAAEFIPDGTVQVVVDGLAWEEREFLEFEETEQFEVGYNDSPPTVRFGDGVVGTIPPIGSSIVVTYVISKGRAGLVGSDVEFVPVTPLVVAFTTIPLVIQNPAGSVGGDDAESLESARSFAPKVWKSGKRAVTREDYLALAGSYADPLFGKVRVADAISPRSAQQDLALQLWLSEIRGLASNAVAPVTASVSAIRSELSRMLTELSNSEGLLESVSQNVTTIHTTNAGAVSGGLIGGLHQTKNDAGDVLVNCTDVDGLVASGKAFVNGSGASPAEKTDINGEFDRIAQEVSDIRSIATGIQTRYFTDVAYVRDIVRLCEDIGLDLTTAGTFLYELDQIRQRLEASVDGPTGINSQVDLIEIAVVDTSASTDELCTKIFNHVDSFLSSDCKANLVVVPILVTDSDGFYAEPSLGLVKSLQDFLSTRKEVTQSVQVVPGSRYLVPAVLMVHIGVRPNFSQILTEVAVRTSIDNMLKGRKPTESLYLSNMGGALKQVAGVGYVNLVIQGSYVMPLSSPPLLSTDRLDSAGNLILNPGEVLTRGLVTVTSYQMTAQEATKLMVDM